MNTDRHNNLSGITMTDIDDYLLVYVRLTPEELQGITEGARLKLADYILGFQKAFEFNCFHEIEIQHEKTYRRPIRIILTIITVYLLTALVITYSTQAITALQWQTKALGIQSVLGTETQDWWLMSPLRIAWDVTVTDPQNIMSGLIALFTWSVRMFVRVR